MGRKAIDTMSFRSDAKERKGSYDRRYTGLLKKAVELSALTGVPVTLFIGATEEFNQWTVFSSGHHWRQVATQFEMVRDSNSVELATLDDGKAYFSKTYRPTAPESIDYVNLMDFILRPAIVPQARVSRFHGRPVRITSPARIKAYG